jgi:hypothetical protein
LEETIKNSKKLASKEVILANVILISRERRKKRGRKEE